MSDPDIYPKKAILSFIFSINVAKNMQNALSISFIYEDEVVRCQGNEKVNPVRSQRLKSIH